LVVFAFFLGALYRMTVDELTASYLGLTAICLLAVVTVPLAIWFHLAREARRRSL
jgi:hypothetical protein